MIPLYQLLSISPDTQLTIVVDNAKSVDDSRAKSFRFRTPPSRAFSSDSVRESRWETGYSPPESSLCRNSPLNLRRKTPHSSSSSFNSNSSSSLQSRPPLLQRLSVDLLPPTIIPSTTETISSFRQPSSLQHGQIMASPRLPRRSSVDNTSMLLKKRPQAPHRTASDQLIRMPVRQMSKRSLAIKEDRWDNSISKQNNNSITTSPSSVLHRLSSHGKETMKAIHEPGLI